LRIINALEDSDIMAEMAARGLGIDQGMALKLNH